MMDMTCSMNSANRVTNTADRTRQRHENPITALSIFKAAREHGWKPWEETSEPWSIAKFESTDSQTVLCAASIAIESTFHGDRATMRAYTKLVAAEVALENLDAETAGQVIADAALNIGVGRDETRLIFDGALRWQRRELKLQMFLATDPYSIISINKKEKAYLERRL
jgi:hypothetical protein